MLLILVVVKLKGNNNNQATTTSLKIAEVFEKNHKNILRDIKNLECPIEFGRLNFELSSYINSQNKEMPCYEVTRDGFTLLAMGFTGKKATEWKVKYINAFNKMEETLKNPKYKPFSVDNDFNKEVDELAMRQLKSMQAKDKAKQMYMELKNANKPCPKEKIISILKDANGSMVRSALVRKTQWLDTHTRNKMLKEMLEEGSIRFVMKETRTKPITTIFLRMQ